MPAEYVILDMRVLVERYQPWLDFVFDQTICAQEFIFVFASVAVDCDINESLFQFLYERYPYAIDYHLDQVQMLIESVIADYYEYQRQFMNRLGLPDFLDYVLVKFIDPYTAMFKISMT